MRQSEEYAREKFAAPRKPALCERLVTETLEQGNELVLVLQDLPLSSAPITYQVSSTYCFSITIILVRY
jgi:hypothetical protein